MAQARAKAITFEEYDRWRNSGGGGPDGPRDDGEGLLSGIWKRWATNIVSAKIEALDALDTLTPQQVVDLNQLKRDFDRVTENGEAALRTIREHSKVANNPLVKALLF